MAIEKIIVNRVIFIDRRLKINYTILLILLILLSPSSLIYLHHVVVIPINYKIAAITKLNYDTRIRIYLKLVPPWNENNVNVEL